MRLVQIHLTRRYLCKGFQRNNQVTLYTVWWDDFSGLYYTLYEFRWILYSESWVNFFSRNAYNVLFYMFDRIFCLFHNLKIGWIEKFKIVVTFLWREHFEHLVWRNRIGCPRFWRETKKNVFCIITFWIGTKKWTIFSWFRIIKLFLNYGH